VTIGWFSFSGALFAASWHYPSSLGYVSEFHSHKTCLENSLSLSFALLQAVQFVLDLHFQVPTGVGFTMHQKVFQSLLLSGWDLHYIPITTFSTKYI